jgi:hypothetical protein
MVKGGNMNLGIPYEENHRINNNILEKRCNKCKKWSPCTNDYFHIYTNNKIDGLDLNCKECRKNISKNYSYTKNGKISNRNRNRKYRKDGKYREYLHNNKDKSLAYGRKREPKNHKISEKEWEACKKYFNHRCAYCGLAIEEHYYTRLGVTKLGDFHREHVDDDGTNDLSNCVPSCGICNSEKHLSKFEDWYKIGNIKYSQERYCRIIRWINNDYKLYIKIK